MTSTEIRAAESIGPEARWLKEIAAQLAELNEHLRSDRALEVVVYPSPDSIPIKISEA